MTKQWTITAPTSLETALTGYLGKAESTCRGVQWSATLHAGQPVELRRNGQPVAWHEATHWARAFANDAIRFFNSIHAKESA